MQRNGDTKRWGSWWQWLRHLRQNPVYLREKGSWGNPNPFYRKLSRYSPFLIIGAIVLGLCGGGSNPALLAGDNDLFILWCLLCLPGVLLSVLTIFALFMAPALTAPSISLEMDRGTWDILRLTPQPTSQILFAKLFGGLARLRIWPVLFVLCLFQGAMMICTAALGDREMGLMGVALGVTLATRPWLEILFAAFTGMYLSTRVRSATNALVFSYAAIIVVRVLNSSGAWLVLGSAFTQASLPMFATSLVGPTAVYLLLIPALAAAIIRRADKIGTLQPYG